LRWGCVTLASVNQPRTSGTGVARAVTHAPENAADGLMARAPRGAAVGPVALGLALLGAAVGSATASASRFAYGTSGRNA
jgi:hypothetical protein